LHPFWYQFIASFFDGFLSKVIALPNIAKKTRAKRLQLLFANASKSDNYCCRGIWKSDKCMGSNKEKKP
jgi:hypothetical protein